MKLSVLLLASSVALSHADVVTVTTTVKNIVSVRYITSTVSGRPPITTGTGEELAAETSDVEFSTQSSSKGKTLETSSAELLASPSLNKEENVTETSVVALLSTQSSNTEDVVVVGTVATSSQTITLETTTVSSETLTSSSSSSSTTSSSLTTIGPSPLTQVTSSTTSIVTTSTLSSLSSSPSSSEIATSTRALDTIQSQLLERTNEKRALHGAPAMTWNWELADYAANYAANNFNCNNVQLNHSGGPYGENLEAGSVGGDAVDNWYNEISLYNYSNPVFTPGTATSPGTGHFTQLIWKSSVELGCAYVTCDNIWRQYTICEYSPRGNIEGYFAENVLPLV